MQPVKSWRVMRVFRPMSGPATVQRVVIARVLQRPLVAVTGDYVPRVRVLLSAPPVRVVLVTLSLVVIAHRAVVHWLRLHGEAMRQIQVTIRCVPERPQRMCIMNARREAAVVPVGIVVGAHTAHQARVPGQVIAGCPVLASLQQN